MMLKYGLLTTILCLLVSAAGSGRAQSQRVDFESKNYIGYKELVADAPSSSARIYGYLSLPPGAQGRVPAVVFMPHSGGYSESQEHWYRAALTSVGFATFFVDNFTPRGLRPPITLRDISYATVVADAYAALAELSKRPEIDPARVALVGFSRGAEAARQAGFESFRKGANAGPLRFAAHVSYYPLCITSLRDPRDHTGAPVLLLLGGRDDLTPARICDDYLNFMKAQNPTLPVQSRLYPEALHLWDDDGSRSGSATVGSVRNCIPLFLSATGEFVSMLRDGKEVPFESGILRCPGGNATVGFSAGVRDRSTKDLVDFLSSLPPPK